MKHLVTKDDFIKWYLTNKYENIMPVAYLEDMNILLIWGIIIEFLATHDVYPIYDQLGHGIVIYNKVTNEYKDRWNSHTADSILEQADIFEQILVMALDEIYIIRDINEDVKEEF